MASADNQVGKKPFNVLVTGFGPFSDYSHNPSWLGVFPLHNTVLSTPTHRISFTCFRVPTSYAAILALIPGIHERPPRLPSSQYPASPTSQKPPYDDTDPVPQPLPAAPEGGYDLVIHVGAGRQGALALELQGHKTGYLMPDWDDELPPVVDLLTSRTGTGAWPTPAEWAEMSRLGLGPLLEKEQKRGFGRGYEGYSELLQTAGDVPRLVAYLKECGFQNSRVSDDAGHYCCDFIYYCSLAESVRLGAGKGSKVQFMHIPPPGKPYEVEDVTQAVRCIAAFYSMEA
ncbi:peptidase C15, pyroglutamyl peptidase I-like protein [Calocera viscosa TUFC12733]|uniref:Peptidase C15, pyroglutamyl peptidase I-like protein n=1 Tax=Calocera viscosa (strain TUFC12733) TaxID=1330018 RepID=A0A167K3Q2_CALVF|nr:peptidase C15, pyroglutamyl peptidase I-like protein [Calocera viscosa TUFC12733]